MKKHYMQGGLGDMVVKKRLITVLEELLEPMRERRKKFEEKPDEVMKMLEEGSSRARVVAAETLKNVREAMHLNYF